MTGPGDPVAFQYPEPVVLLGLPPLASRSCLGTKKNHCSASPRHLSPATSAKKKVGKKPKGKLQKKHLPKKIGKFAPITQQKHTERGRVSYTDHTLSNNGHI